MAGEGALAGPGVGVRPSLKALAIEEAFHFAYVIFSLTCMQKENGTNQYSRNLSGQRGVSGHLSMCTLTSVSRGPNILRISKKLEAAKNSLAVALLNRVYRKSGTTVSSLCLTA